MIEHVMQLIVGGSVGTPPANLCAIIVQSFLELYEGTMDFWTLLVRSELLSLGVPFYFEDEVHSNPRRFSEREHRISFHSIGPNLLL
ncbi:hypothetical protein RvY_07005 [Ramazzottius varieornatus]|uniref:Uncharacterized protein n=1 Tax=Ramazzottius varieornatus TaxID=947166 RepID=A0A1D1V6U7_RAMVA|nr:hypothetical protein RvY_07005 [Ramazzottius varieornatus]